jgi:hypothetical protein
MRFKGNKRPAGFTDKLKRMFHRTAFAVASVVALAPLAASGVATAAPTYTLTPWEYVGAAGDCGDNYPAGTPGGVKSEWTNAQGDPAPALMLKKTSPTFDCSSAGATFNNVAGITITNLEFDVKSDGLCTGGSPRFNLNATDGFHFIGGCGNGTQTDADTGWTHVTFNLSDASQAFPAVASGAKVNTLRLVLDEQGTSYIDNVKINDQLIGGPNLPLAKDDCKNNGYKNYTDNSGKTFKNQGLCVSFFNGRDNPGNEPTL